MIRVGDRQDRDRPGQRLDPCMLLALSTERRGARGGWVRFNNHGWSWSFRANLPPITRRGSV